MIEVRGVTFSHNGSRETVLREIDFLARGGEITAVLGPNGSGKTTLFQCLLGIWKFQKGDVLFEGESMKHLKRVEIARRISSVPQEHEPPFPYTCFDIVLMGRTAHVDVFSSPGEKDSDLAHEAMEALGIRHLASRPYTRVSGGERQMVLVARCLAQNAPVMLLDEPSAHLDFRNQNLILAKVKQIVRERGLTVIMNLHDPNMALMFSDQVLLLKQGRLIAHGTPDDAITRKNLWDVYGLEVEFLTGSGLRMICPRI